MNTFEKINDVLVKLFEVAHVLDLILEQAGQDSETKYTQRYLDLLDDIKDMQNDLKVLLENHHSTIMDVEYETVLS